MIRTVVLTVALLALSRSSAWAGNPCGVFKKDKTHFGVAYELGLDDWAVKVSHDRSRTLVIQVGKDGNHAIALTAGAVFNVRFEDGRDYSFTTQGQIEPQRQEIFGVWWTEWGIHADLDDAMVKAFQTSRPVAVEIVLANGAFHAVDVKREDGEKVLRAFACLGQGGP
jgi:hypothetical protein